MIDAYRQRAGRHAALRDALRRRSTFVARFRLASFLAGATFFIAGLRLEQDAAVYTGLALFSLFGALVVRHARIEEGLDFQEALRVVNERAVARIERRWDDLAEEPAPPSVDTAHHPYAIDLDLFGRASLFQLLGPGATPLGSTMLARWLVEPAPREEIQDRQEAIRELVDPVEWRLELAAHGQLAHGWEEVDVARLLAWAEGPPAPHLRLLFAIIIVILVSFWVLLALTLWDVLASAWFGIPLVAALVISFALGTRLQAAFDRAGSGERSLERYASLLEQASARTFASSRLARLHALLSGDGGSPRAMRRLNHILGFAELRRGAAILHAPIQALTLWDFWVLFALERWRRTAGAHVRQWLEALAEIDALAVLAALQHDNPGWARPEIVDEPLYTADALGHPLLPETHRVVNDVVVGPPGSILLVTGSNMSGKSTLLRAIGLNVVLAQAGGCVCASRLRTPAVTLQTSIRVQDSLELGLSYFMAALARLKAVVDAAETSRGGPQLMYLLDEILQGTNSAERSVAVRAVARHLLDAGAIGAMTTHDLSLAGEEPLNSAARLVHFTETVDASGKMSFDYRLRPGLATSRNALRLMQMIGIDVKPS